MNKTLLLSSPVRSLGPIFKHEFNNSPNLPYPINWIQGPFRNEVIILYYGLELIALNISVSTVVLHFPSMNTFIHEIKKGYEYVGLSFPVVGFDTIKEQVKLIRRYAPRSKIILGGPGTLLPEDELSEWSDLICHGDGIHFMRELFHEDDSQSNPVTLPLLPLEVITLSVPYYPKVGLILQSVGCPNGCDFCTTTHLFQKKKRTFIKTGQQLYDTLKRAKEKNKHLNYFFIFDEDFLADYERASEFLALVRENDAIFNLTIYTTVRSLMKFSIADIVAMGIRIAWVGVEGLRTDYPKVKGLDFKKVVSGLQAHGIGVILSYVMGYDYQTEEIIRDECEQLMKLEPFMLQQMIFTSCATLPSWERLKKEGRINEGICKRYDLYNGYNLLYDHPTITREQMQALHIELITHEYKTLGPSIYRYNYMLFKGFLQSKDSNDPFLRKQSENMREMVKRSLFNYRVGILFAPTPEVREKLKRWYKESVSVIGPLSILDYFFSYVLILLYLWTCLRFKYNIFIAPPFRRRVFTDETREQYRM